MIVCTIISFKHGRNPAFALSRLHIRFGRWPGLVSIFTYFISLSSSSGLHVKYVVDFFYQFSLFCNGYDFHSYDLYPNTLSLAVPFAKKLLYPSVHITRPKMKAMCTRCLHFGSGETTIFAPIGRSHELDNQDVRGPHEESIDGWVDPRNVFCGMKKAAKASIELNLLQLVPTAPTPPPMPMSPQRFLNDHRCFSATRISSPEDNLLIFPNSLCSIYEMPSANQDHTPSTELPCSFLSYERSTVHLKKYFLNTECNFLYYYPGNPMAIGYCQQINQVLSLCSRPIKGRNYSQIFWCYSHLSSRVIQPSFDAQSLCRLHSDCAKTSTHAKMWSLDDSLAEGCCMSTAGMLAIQKAKLNSLCIVNVIATLIYGLIPNSKFFLVMGTHLSTFFFTQKGLEFRIRPVCSHLFFFFPFFISFFSQSVNMCAVGIEPTSLMSISSVLTFVGCFSSKIVWLKSHHSSLMNISHEFLFLLFKIVFIHFHFFQHEHITRISLSFIQDLIKSSILSPIKNFKFSVLHLGPICVPMKIPPDFFLFFSNKCPLLEYQTSTQYFYILFSQSYKGRINPGILLIYLKFGEWFGSSFWIINYVPNSQKCNRNIEEYAEERDFLEFYILYQECLLWGYLILCGIPLVQTCNRMFQLDKCIHEYFDKWKAACENFLFQEDLTLLYKRGVNLIGKYTDDKLEKRVPENKVTSLKLGLSLMRNKYILSNSECHFVEHLPFFSSLYGIDIFLFQYFSFSLNKKNHSNDSILTCVCYSLFYIQSINYIYIYIYVGTLYITFLSTVTVFILRLEINDYFILIGYLYGSIIIFFIKFLCCVSMYLPFDSLKGLDMIIFKEGSTGIQQLYISPGPINDPQMTSVIRCLLIGPGAYVVKTHQLLPEHFPLSSSHTYRLDTNKIQNTYNQTYGNTSAMALCVRQENAYIHSSISHKSPSEIFHRGWTKGYSSLFQDYSYPTLQNKTTQK
ncbi:hypothetical protein VP01_287g2 [Puccinia sorghi]|uniref:Uncharacterized protein n=1 Tax=Puccinia sorghi TaxID=27349 RepID=A0A0L6V1R9_9BASI|nr:hypothetical protein VP01_287g2 [Puccinia sorghi]